MEMNKMWAMPEKEEQDLLRARIIDCMNRKPRSRNSLAHDAQVSPNTIKKFVVLEEKIDWLSFHKITAMVERWEKMLNEPN